MNRCKVCVMPDTRPGLVFNEQGVCMACVRHAERKNVDWSARKSELLRLVARLKDAAHPSLRYDCIIAVSGGKDSHFQVKTLKEDYGLNPLLVSINNLPTDWTGAGLQNASNLITRFDCERLNFDLSPASCKKMFRWGFEQFGTPTWYWDRAVYTVPLWIAYMMNIPTVFYGENISWEYGGPNAEDSPSAKKQLLNNVACGHSAEELAKAGLDPDRAAWMNLPQHVLEAVDPRYLSYYLPWSGSHNKAVAEIYGFHPLESYEHRDGFIENYDQIDAYGYLVHCWMKYPKYGHARATDVASYWIRDGLITRDFALQLVEKNDHLLDASIRSKFCDFCGYNPDEFANIVLSHTKKEFAAKTKEALTFSYGGFCNLGGQRDVQ